RRGRTVNSTTDAIFAMDTKSGKRQWIYRGKNIMHVTIAIGGGKIYFIESTISPEERDALLRQDKTELEKLTGEAREKKEKELKSLDVRRAVALDAKTGKELWRKAIDVTSVSGISAGGGNLALMYHDGHVAICGANANGHYWRQFLSGEFSKRRIVVLDSKSGEKLWSKDANYMNRPAIINDMVLAEPWAFDLHTGKEKTRTHPLTGLETNWQFSRPGHHCGIVTATPNMMFFRSGFIGYYDLYADSGTRHFAGQRLGCWVNAIPGNGLLMIPEASAGCVCLFSITSTVVLEPREDRTAAWGIYSAAGKRTPVKHLALNLGAPGDRRDEFGTLWLGYPRPASRGRMEYVFDVKPQIASGGGYYVWNEESVNVAEADTPWVFTSGAHGLTRCELPLLGKDDGPAKFTVKLYFADLAENKTRSGNFDIKLQGQSVAEDVEIESAAGGKNRAFIQQFKGVEVKDNLIIELIGKKGLASIAGIEVIRE
ncbi:MAG: PQQ-binding-like beta-propeller repeat protein, partial [Planctomycetes bacterium]|nr:PQQ-binding-like beta-propeller repeat protein [Planctomycetota bacterium]